MQLRCANAIGMKIENQLTKTVNYYTLIYREVGLLQHTTVATAWLEARRGTVRTTKEMVNSSVVVY